MLVVVTCPGGGAADVAENTGILRSPTRIDFGFAAMGRAKHDAKCGFPCAGCSDALPAANAGWAGASAIEFVAFRDLQSLAI